MKVKIFYGPATDVEKHINELLKKTPVTDVVNIQGFGVTRSKEGEADYMAVLVWLRES